MPKSQVRGRLDKGQLVRAGKALGTGTATETIKPALVLATEKATHDTVIRKYGGEGGKDAFASR